MVLRIETDDERRAWEEAKAAPVSVFAWLAAPATPAGSPETGR